MKALDITHLEKQPDTYALFGDDGHVYIARHGQPPVPIAQLPNVTKTERFIRTKDNGERENPESIKQCKGGISE